MLTRKVEVRDGYVRNPIQKREGENGNWVAFVMWDAATRKLLRAYLPRCDYDGFRYSIADRNPKRGDVLEFAADDFAGASRVRNRLYVRISAFDLVAKAPGLEPTEGTIEGEEVSAADLQGVTETAQPAAPSANGAKAHDRPEVDLRRASLDAARVLVGFARGELPETAAKVGDLANILGELSARLWYRSSELLTTEQCANPVQRAIEAAPLERKVEAAARMGGLSTAGRVASLSEPRAERQPTGGDDLYTPDPATIAPPRAGHARDLDEAKQSMDTRLARIRAARKDEAAIAAPRTGLPGIVDVGDGRLIELD